MTDKHCRVFHPQLTRNALLYTEMLKTGAVIHGDRDHLIGFDPCQHPVARLEMAYDRFDSGPSLHLLFDG